MKFTFPLHGLVQGLGIAATVANILGSFFPAGSKGQVITGGIIAGVQAAAGLIAHFKTPDGSPIPPAAAAPKPGGVGTINPIG